jgi:hypothetical protein
MPAVNPVTRPALEGGQLRFRNPAVEAGAAPAPQAYRARWYRFDNATGTAAPVAASGATPGTGSDGTTQSPTTSLPLPQLPPLLASEFIKVEISASGAPVPAWEQPVSAYFRRAGAGWRLVGFERLP